MDQRTQFLLQVLEKIGSPLTMAVAAVPGNQAGSEAQRVAELLNKSVQLGLALADGMNVRDESQADGVHLALAAFAGPLVAGQYMTSGGRVPGDLEIRRMAGALQAVLTFADNFTPAADTTIRLQNNEPGSESADESLIHVQMMNAFAPMLQAVAQYTFGRQENKLVQDIAARIFDRAETMRADIFGADLPVKQARRIDLVLVKMMSGVYAGAHMGEMARLMSLSEQDRAVAMATPGGVSMDPIWMAFDRQVAMIRILGEQVIPAQTAAGSARAGGGPAPIKNMEKQPAIQPPPATVPAIAALAAAPETTIPAGNPMAFFGKKSADGS